MQGIISIFKGFTQNTVNNLVSLLSSDATFISNVSGNVEVDMGNKVLFVATTGNDATAQKGLLTKPYETPRAAKQAATNGDTVVLFPGTYEGYDLFKDGVNWHGLGAKIVNTGTDKGGIFDDSVLGLDAPVNCKITGALELEAGMQPASDYEQYAIHVANPASVVDINISSITSNNGSPLIVRDGTVNISGTKIVCNVDDNAAFIAGGNVTIKNCLIESNGWYSVGWSTGLCRVEDCLIRSHDNDTIYSTLRFLAIWLASYDNPLGETIDQVEAGLSPSGSIELKGCRIENHNPAANQATLLCKYNSKVIVNDCVMWVANTLNYSINALQPQDLLLYGKLFSNGDVNGSVTDIFTGLPHPDGTTFIYKPSVE